MEDIFMDKDNVQYSLDDDWKMLSPVELLGAAFHVVQENSIKVHEKLKSVTNDDDISINIMDKVWNSMNLHPMDFVKRLDPENIASALIDCNAKEVATVIRFIENETREKVLKLLSGESGADWREAEKHIENNIVKLHPEDS
jgi:flagellar motor switch protein FliG